MSPRPACMDVRTPALGCLLHAKPCWCSVEHCETHHSPPRKPKEDMRSKPNSQLCYTPGLPHMLLDTHGGKTALKYLLSLFSLEMYKIKACCAVIYQSVFIACSVGIYCMLLQTVQEYSGVFERTKFERTRLKNHPGQEGRGNLTTQYFPLEKTCWFAPQGNVEQEQGTCLGWCSWKNGSGREARNRQEHWCRHIHWKSGHSKQGQAQRF